MKESLLNKKKLEEELNYFLNKVPFAINGVTLYRMFVTGFNATEMFNDPLTATQRHRVEAILRNKLSEL